MSSGYRRRGGRSRARSRQKCPGPNSGSNRFAKPADGTALCGSSQRSRARTGQSATRRRAASMICNYPHDNDPLPAPLTLSSSCKGCSSSSGVFGLRRHREIRRRRENIRAAHMAKLRREAGAEGGDIRRYGCQRRPSIAKGKNKAQTSRLDGIHLMNARTVLRRPVSHVCHVGDMPSG